MRQAMIGVAVLLGLAEMDPAMAQSAVLAPIPEQQALERRACQNHADAVKALAEANTQIASANRALAAAKTEGAKKAAQQALANAQMVAARVRSSITASESQYDAATEKLVALGGKPVCSIGSARSS